MKILRFQPIVRKRRNNLMILDFKENNLILANEQRVYKFMPYENTSLILDISSNYILNPIDHFIFVDSSTNDLFRLKLINLFESSKVNISIFNSLEQMGYKARRDLPFTTPMFEGMMA
ncbi:hypothetical protein ACMGD3_24310 [Lysinibacillus sphaericus]|uniref:hypothetical protein n=1 Tax=Lysinibacillus sphaericus TaxID=1421 RepID=UPI003F7AC1D2